VILDAFAVGPTAITGVIREAHWSTFIIVGRGVVTNESFNGNASGEQVMGQGGFRGWGNDMNVAWGASWFGGTAPAPGVVMVGGGQPVTIEGVRPERSKE
jgi:hypothetical protein